METAAWVTVGHGASRTCGVVMSTTRAPFGGDKFVLVHARDGRAYSVLARNLTPASGGGCSARSPYRCACAEVAS